MSVPEDGLRTRLDPTNKPVGYGISARRIVLVNALVAIIAIPSLYDTFTGEEHWPYSNYPMFSKVEFARAPRYNLYGLTMREPFEEILLPLTSYAGPLNNLRVQAALAKMDASETRDNELREALRYFLANYETHRLSKSSERPPLRGVRLYRVDRSVNATTGSPGLLIAEEYLPSEEP